MRTYNELRLEERVDMQQRLESGGGLRAIGRSLGRSASTISRECRRSRAERSGYKAQTAQQRSQQCRAKPRLTDSASWETAQALLRARWSPEQIAGILTRGFPAATRGADRRGQTPNMQSIHALPPDVADQLIPGHCEGDIFKGAGNRSSVGTLIDRTSGFVIVAKMSSASAADAVESFGKALKSTPEALRKTLTYDQGKEISCHDALTLRTDAQVYHADPHSPWQRGSNENSSGLLRQYLPKGTDLSVYSQVGLNQIVLNPNTRPCKRHQFRTPLEVYNDHLLLTEANTGTIH